MIEAIIYIVWAEKGIVDMHVKENQDSGKRNHELFVAYIDGGSSVPKPSGSGRVCSYS